MKTKQITGIALVSIGFGALSFLYFGYIKPRLVASQQAKLSQTKKQITTK